LATYLYKIQPVRPDMLKIGATPAEDQTVDEHFAYLERLTKQSVILLSGRTLTDEYSSFGIVIIQADNYEAARLIVQNDPVVSQRIKHAELYPFKIALKSA